MRKPILLLGGLGLLVLLLAAFHSRPLALRNFHPDTTAPYFKAKDFKGKSVVSTSGVISFTTGLENDFYPADSLHRSGELYVEVKLAKLLNLPQKRTPLNISIVIDRSGSMQGVKMGFAKKAAKAIIDQLLPEDFVSIVIYDNSVDSLQTPVSPTNKDAIRSRIDGITPRGATDLWGGTEQGYRFVQRNYRSGCINRVLLISDGLANAGLTDSAQIMRNVQLYKDEQGITLSTFGVGLDYNENLMTAMAETASGNYYFIDSPDKIVPLFNKELTGLLNVVAQEASSEISLPQGVQVTKGYPLPYTQHDRVLTVRLRDLFAEDTKSTWFHFTMDDHMAGELVFTSTLHYTDVLDGKEKTATNRNVMSATRMLDPYLTHFNKGVIEQVILFTASENMERAMALVDKGRHEEAQKLLGSNKDYLLLNRRFTGDDANMIRLDSANLYYQAQARQAATMSTDSLKKLQKKSKELNYRIRNKKQ